jgi:cell division protease FtsH
MQPDRKQTEPNRFQDLLKQRSGCTTQLIWIAVMILVSYGLWSLVGGGLDSRTQIPYSTFLDNVESGIVESVLINGNQIQGTLTQPAEYTPEGAQEPVEYTQFTTYTLSFGDNELLPLLRENSVKITVQPQTGFSFINVLSIVLPFLLLLGLGYILLRQIRNQGGGSGIFSMGRSQARLYDRQKGEVTFEDVAGLQGAKQELVEIVEYLKDPTRFRRLGGDMPKGVLLVGPPGTGKTLIARAVAGEANVPFFSITGSNFMEMFVGVGASRVRAMFEDAKKVSPCIIFIDELDSIGRRRGAGIGGGHDEREQTLNQLLSEMDGFESHENVIIMAATNRPDILDPALLRPGRFDRQIAVDLPSLKDRVKILEIHARGKPLAETVDLEEVARGTPGFSGADLENLLNEAALLAARNDQEQIEQENIEEAHDKVLMGLRRENLELTDEECGLLAHHEAGHAVVASVLPKSDPVHKVTIVPRGRAMGVTQQIPERDRYLYDQEYAFNRLAVMMGGRAAEILFFDTITSGAENDLQQATQLARKMILDWGMSEALGPVALGGRKQQVFLGEEIAQRREYSEATAREIDKQVKVFLENALERACTVIQSHSEGFQEIVKALMEQEEISGEMVSKILKRGEEKEEIEALAREPESGV